MQHFYFVSNNLLSTLKIHHPNATSFYEKRVQTLISKKGEEKAVELCRLKNIQGIEAIYSSNYISALETAKYIAEEKKLDVFIDERLNERVVGELGTNEYRFLKGMQEHDFHYKLRDGESIKDTSARMFSFLNDLLYKSEENVLIVTHNIALLSLALIWCNKGFNLDDRLILDYKEHVIFDGIYHEMDVIEFVFDHKQFVEIKRII